MGYRIHYGRKERHWRGRGVGLLLLVGLLSALLLRSVWLPLDSFTQTLRQGMPIRQAVHVFVEDLRGLAEVH